MSNILLQRDGTIGAGELCVLITSTLFLESATDFPDSAAASLAVNSVVAILGWEYSLCSLLAAHSLCKQSGQYWPMAAALAN
jgi:hypothetical protein